MVNLQVIITGLCILFFTSALISCRSVLHSQSDFDFSGRFDEYRSFKFLTQNSSTSQEGLIIEKYIDKRLSSMGYHFEENMPDLIISYNQYPNGVNIRGFNQPDLNSWLIEGTKDIESDCQEGLIDGKGKIFSLENYTLQISFFDRMTGTTVWQGYMSGNSINMRSQNAKIQVMVNSILDDYRIPARGHLALLD